MRNWINLTSLKKTFARSLCGAVLGVLAMSASAAEVMERQLIVAVFSYLDHPAFDIKIGNERVGSTGKFFPFGRPRLKAGVVLAEGSQPVSWMVALAESGTEAVKASNTPKLGGFSADTRYLGVHIYPGNSVEFVLSSAFPVYTARGKAISEQLQRDGAK